MKSEHFGFACLVNTIFLFSTYEVVSKTLVGKIDPFQINFIRFFVGGLLLLCIILLKKDYLISAKDLLGVSFLGVVNVVISMSFLQLSLYVPNAKASVVAVIFSSNPIFVILFSALINKEEIDFYKLIGVLLGVVGIVIIFFEKLTSGFFDYKSPILALVSSIFYGLYTVIGRNISLKIGSLKMNSYSFIIGSLLLLPFLMFLRIPVFVFDYSGIYQVIFLSLFVTGLAYLTYFEGLSIIGASKGSLVFFIKPVLASAIAIVFLAEKATLNLLCGTLMILIGITIITRWPEIKIKIFKTIEGILK